jgi:RNA-directed DNA polymerase
MTKPYEISRHLVWKAYQQVKANKGAAGIDRETIQEFEKDRKSNLYKLWNRMSSGSYFPPPVKGVEIPKKTCGKRMLGIPTVADRIAQTVVSMTLEPLLEPVFHQDSYGFRPGRSAHDALAVVRERCWKYDWVVELDIRKCFDTIDHGLLSRALEKHCHIPWVILYVRRWLIVPLETSVGTLVERNEGTPQGGVVSPLLANLFLHYAFDRWVSENLPGVPFCRYADDGVLHCKSEAQAKLVVNKIKVRFEVCGLELHPEKTRIVYCADSNRKGKYPVRQFTFLGYTFRQRRAVNRHGQLFMNFVPAVSRDALRNMRQTIRRWKLQFRCNQDVSEMARQINPVLRGWLNYYGKFHRSAMDVIWRHMNLHLVRWMMMKYKNLQKHKTKAGQMLWLRATANPQMFVHWQVGYLPMAG